MIKSRFGLLSLLALILSASLPVTAAAAEAGAPEPIPNHPALNDLFTFTAGVYAAQSSTNALVTPAGGGTGVGVDFENTLGLEERTAAGMASFLWRITDRWRVETEYFRLNRDATRTLSEQITWNGVTYNVGDTVDTSFDFYDLRIGGGYSFYKTRDKELGVGAGLHLSGMTASIGTASGTFRDESDVLVPLPVLSLFGNFAMTDEWALRMRFDWFSLSYGDYSGDLTTTAMEVVYQPFRHVGFGLGLRNYILDVEMENEDWNGRARVAFRGPTVFVVASF